MYFAILRNALWLILALPLSVLATEPQQAVFAQFFQQLSLQCGKAYPGKLTLEPPGDDMLTGTELLIVHFRECSETQLKVPFHIELEASQEWNRSRTWIFTKHADRLELRHDHRTKAGTDDKITMYGGFSYGEGSVIRHDFQSVERTAESGFYRGWRIEIEPGVRYTYGTVRGKEWSWRIDFDLSQPLPEIPPAPWGHSP
ncbi:hypothetical protein [Alishewanella tabrizica]|uniref:Secreted protein n=1 Tax=Alishewanella tabrizica TaxID=671278 RepID=A0ABQ2WWF6_9ALTE|nr:hypothetical protein [Alishewanella tabrizica]GGW72080.1 hypothetical protein GCM10008111_30330 [Alishewanella tabrizica]